MYVAGTERRGTSSRAMTIGKCAIPCRCWTMTCCSPAESGTVSSPAALRVISTGSTEAKRELARRLGAEFILDTKDPDWTGQIRKITNKKGVDLVVEHVGGKIFEQLFSCLARDGTIVTCGATTGRDVALNLWPLFVKQQRIVGSYGRNSADLKATLDWASNGKLKPVIDRTLPLEQTPEAFQLLRSRQVLGKIVVEPCLSDTKMRTEI